MELSMELTRAASKIVDLEGRKSRNVYTTWGLQQATAHSVAKKMTAAECTAKYGVGGSTLRSKPKALDLPPNESGRPPSFSVALSVANRAAKKDPNHTSKTTRRRCSSRRRTRWLNI
eukprot:TRINITY_DN5072_c0_g1_i1.p1 TRINITY_DN5072_c0_g1~~TRINITY_DN5072_c0_g1_i1.p1  ORF type:complete len:117 (+),score=13.19 TRINITY_DN5072_c0_g1_i1:312-662(+)